MRIVALADVHGNLRALEAVRRDLTRFAPDLIVNLGDHASGPLQARETTSLLMAEPWVHIRGNHDRQLNDRPVEAMGPSDRAAHAQLSSEQLDWLNRLPTDARLDQGIYLCHGAPDDDLRYLLEEIQGERTRLAEPDEIRPKLDGIDARLVLCGHTHVPRLLGMPDGLWIVNPGSVGLQAYNDDNPFHWVEVGSPHARYAVIDWDGRTPNVQFVALEYDWDSAGDEARRGGRLDWEAALRTGRAI